MTTYVKSRTSTTQKAIYLILIALATVALGTLFGFIGNTNKGYSGLVRPSFTPPDVIFSIIWPILYFMMGASLYLTAQTLPLSTASKRARIISIVLFTVQLLVNLTWPIAFFRAEMYLFAFVWLELLVALVTALMLINFKVNLASAVLLIPYLAWLFFATYLNLMIVVYN